MRSQIHLAGLLFMAIALPLKASPSANLPFDGVAQGHCLTNNVMLRATNNVAGLQCDFLFDASRLVCTNAAQFVSGPAGVVADGALIGPGRYRLLVYSPAGSALTNDVLCSVIFSAATNAYNGQVPLVAGAAIFGDANAVGIATGVVNPGLVLVGDAFGFVPGGGRVQFRTINGSNYVIHASEDLTKWTFLSTNTATEELVWTMDTNALALAHRFYRSVAAP